MNEQQSTNEKRDFFLALLIALVGIGGTGFLGFQLMQAKEELSKSMVQRSVLEADIAAKAEEYRILSEALYSERKRNEELEEDLEDIEDTVDELEKLSKIDPELLQKYSKVYFLNEHYAPSAFSTISSEYRYPEGEAMSIHRRVWPFLEDLLEAAEKEKIDLRVASAFRSFNEQSSLKSHYSVTYGAGSANQFSADQGYSEHQLGTTVDFTTAASGGRLDGFQTTPAYEWLLENAHRYGFVLSYPEGNAYYVFEPWHWRFVGKDLARDLRREKIGFYDMDQRDIDEYLVKLFDR